MEIFRLKSWTHSEPPPRKGVRVGILSASFKAPPGTHAVMIHLGNVPEGTDLTDDLLARLLDQHGLARVLALAERWEDAMPSDPQLLAAGELSDTIRKERANGELLGPLLDRYGAKAVVAALGVMAVAGALGVVPGPEDDDSPEPSWEDELPFDPEAGR